MSDIERVKEVINWVIFEKIAKNRKEIAKMLDYTESSFSQIINSKVTLSTQFIKKLSKLDERINLNWLLTGEGSMLKDDAIKNSSILNVGDGNISNMGAGSVSGSIHLNSNQQLLSRIEELEKQIELLERAIADKDKIIALYEKLNP